MKVSSVTQEKALPQEASETQGVQSRSSEISSLQLASQPSCGSRLPSSQLSPLSRMASPHVAGRQSVRQASGAVSELSKPSSQPSSLSRTASPQLEGKQSVRQASGAVSELLRPSSQPSPSSMMPSPQVGSTVPVSPLPSGVASAEVSPLPSTEVSPLPSTEVSVLAVSSPPFSVRSREAASVPQAANSDMRQRRALRRRASFMAYPR